MAENMTTADAVALPCPSGESPTTAPVDADESRGDVWLEALCLIPGPLLGAYLVVAAIWRAVTQ